MKRMKNGQESAEAGGEKKLGNWWNWWNWWKLGKEGADQP